MYVSGGSPRADVMIDLHEGSVVSVLDDSSIHFLFLFFFFFLSASLCSCLCAFRWDLLS